MAEPDSTLEEKAYHKYKQQYAWLQLNSSEGTFFLGCKLCEGKVRKTFNGSFAAGTYRIKKYFYERTLKEHERSAGAKQWHVKTEAVDAFAIDILQICFKYKNLLEVRRSMDEVCELAAELRKELDGFCGHSCVLAEAMSAEHPDLPGGKTASEEMCKLQLGFGLSMQLGHRQFSNTSGFELFRDQTL